jgi:hypothetical protein
VKCLFYLRPKSNTWRAINGGYNGEDPVQLLKNYRNIFPDVPVDEMVIPWKLHLDPDDILTVPDALCGMVSAVREEVLHDR